MGREERGRKLALIKSLIDFSMRPKAQIANASLPMMIQGRLTPLNPLLTKPVFDKIKILPPEFR